MTLLRMPTRPRAACWWLGWLMVGLVVLAPLRAGATNGMNLIGYGAVSCGMGGADLALVDNATAMNINPAGLSGCCQPEISAGLSLMQSRNHHADSHGNDLLAREQQFPLPLLAWASPLPDSAFIVGCGIFAQGGMGLEYHHFRTPFADRAPLPREHDSLSSNLSYMKITPTLAWRRSDDRLRLGISLNLGYAEADMRLFPATSLYLPASAACTELGFFGVKMKDARAYSAALRLGFQYRWGDFTLAGAYLSATDQHFRGGRAQVNYNAIGAGRRGYEAELDGFNWPQQIGLGCSYQVSPALRLALDVDWINWSQAIDRIRFSLHRNQADEVPQRIRMNYPMHWNDQWVIALGLEYRLSSRWRLRGGYNYGKSPVPSRYLLPYFPAIAEQHLTAGLGYAAGRWRLDLACEWALPHAQASHNSLYCHHGFKEEMSQFTTHLLLHYRL